MIFHFIFILSGTSNARFFDFRNPVTYMDFNEKDDREDDDDDEEENNSPVLSPTLATSTVQSSM